MRVNRVRIEHEVFALAAELLDRGDTVGCCRAIVQAFCALNPAPGLYTAAHDKWRRALDAHKHAFRDVFYPGDYAPASQDHRKLGYWWTLDKNGDAKRVLSLLMMANIARGK